jgi:hypothetical protein
MFRGSSEFGEPATRIGRGAYMGDALPAEAESRSVVFITVKRPCMVQSASLNGSQCGRALGAPWADRRRS